MYYYLFQGLFGHNIHIHPLLYNNHNHHLPRHHHNHHLPRHHHNHHCAFMNITLVFL